MTQERKGVDMHYYHPFERSGLSYEARVGLPDALSAAIGQVVLQFADLDAELSATLRRLTVGDAGWGLLLTAALPFAEKLAWLEARVRALGPRGAFNTGTIDPGALFAELQAQCLRAAQLYAEVLDPDRVANTWLRISELQVATGRRRRRPGRRVRAALAEAAALLDIADFIGMVVEDVREFFQPGEDDGART
jgi:hypothetical protein